MNWTQFLLGTAALYFFYYGLNILYDVSRREDRPFDEVATDELVFEEDIRPVTVEPERETPHEPGVASNSEPQTRSVLSSGSIQSTGAVNLKKLFVLAQSDLIEYTKAIPY